MAIELSYTDIERTLVELQDDLYQQLKLESNEAFLVIPAFIGTGSIRGIRLRDGLDLFVQEFVVKEDLMINGESFASHEAHSSLAFCLSGRFSSTLPGLSSRYTMGPKQTSFYTSPHMGGTLELKAGKPIHLVEITFSLALLLDLIGEELTGLPQNLQDSLLAGASQAAVYFFDISNEVSRILHKIIYCPYHGKIRGLYLEGKVLELVSLYFSQFCPPSNPASSLPIKHQDLDRLYDVREILQQNLIAPPSLETLSKQSGLSERKLQQGFRELFGTTVFGVLHNDRMERARQLLETQQMTVSSIADMVGITHRGHFAKAFKRKFGSTPREYLKRIK